MPNRRKPSKILALSGSFDKNPQLLASRMDMPRNIPALDTNPPRRLNELQITAWRQITTQAPENVLTRADNAAVELAARLLAESWENYDEMSNPRMTLLVKLLASLGCVPSERHKIEVTEDPAEKPKNRFLND